LADTSTVIPVSTPLADISTVIPVAGPSYKIRLHIRTGSQR